MVKKDAYRTVRKRRHQEPVHGGEEAVQHVSLLGSSILLGVDVVVPSKKASGIVAQNCWQALEEGECCSRESET